MAISSSLAFLLPLTPDARPSPFPSVFRLATHSTELSPTRLRKSQLRASSNWNPTPEPEKPIIQLEFIGPMDEVDGAYSVEKTRINSGEKLLRNIMLDNKIELYATFGKLMNCGGGGSCGTCIVEIVEGENFLNERTDTEKKHLKKKPETWRLACQTIVGNKENFGKVVVRRMPQRRKKS